MSDFYDAKAVEEKFYKICEERGYFELDGNKNIQEKGKNFCIMMPPPNVTGVLHMGHSLTFTLQDIITRYKRMDGYRALYQPGMDHAGIATQNIVEKRLLAQGIKKETLGREKFVDEIWKWKEQSGGTILKQMRRLGITPAWSRLRFTMDEGLKSAVRRAFVSLYNSGLIVRGNYMVNWCTHDGALSDVEVEHKENKGKLYYLRYYLVDSGAKFDGKFDANSNLGAKFGGNSGAKFDEISGTNSAENGVKIGANLSENLSENLAKNADKISNFAMNSAQISAENAKFDEISATNLSVNSSENLAKNALYSENNASNLVTNLNGKSEANLNTKFSVNSGDNLGENSNTKFGANSAQNAPQNLPYIIVATTRPETYFGDTAVMVNPADARYSHLIGRKVVLPIVRREIEIIADEHVDMGFGTGAVKVTPAHDQNDYEVGKRHNLEFITIFDEKGILNEYCGEFAGLERLAAREIVADKLSNLGFVEKIEDYENQVGYCYRCKNVVEPYISKQWFVRTDIAQKAIADANAGAVKFYPAHWINSFNAWMRELKDWCISRQLWWGHRIPVFYCECGHEWADENEHPTCCPKCGGTHFHQDPDVLDTWFSSGLWPISTLGWGNGEIYKNEKWNESDLREFYPNTMLITGFDILFFWVARMMFQCENAVGNVPFRDAYLHALVKTADGSKMSKSSGNVIDPLDKIDEYSADILRFTLTLLCVQGRDIRLSEEKMVLVRNFTNKLFNAHKFLLLNAPKFEDLDAIKVRTNLGRYMLSRFQNCVGAVRENLDSYRFNDAANEIYKFLWDEFCDWGIELSKADKSAIGELGAIFKEAMKLLSPFMPFISEYLWHELSGTSLENAESIMIARYPKIAARDEKIEELFALIIEAIVSIRRAKATIELGNSRVAKAYVKFGGEFGVKFGGNFGNSGVNLGVNSDEILGDKFGDSSADLGEISDMNLSAMKDFIRTLAKCDEIEFTSVAVANSARDVGEKVESFVPLAGVDTSAIVARLTSQKIKLEKEILKLENMLSNEKFIASAPTNVIETNRAGLVAAKEKMAKVMSELANLGTK